ncbi:CLUMA_CG017096, isoform A [Clunio marinus]|uniref:CLUMA_CG017096, isoform A n=1 Tax=Clunio marinus TaxID=568069 RepID=A0A1J1IUW6_9DIPT|nr:CLUMA_CG017096, isoform A [Clunio marinus]
MNYYCSLAIKPKLLYLGIKLYFCKVPPEGDGNKLTNNLSPAPSGVLLQKYNLSKKVAKCIKEQLSPTYFIPKSDSL